MSRRRGFFAELNHQAQLAEKRRQQQARAAARAQATAQRQAEQAQRASERVARTAASSEQARRQAAEREAAAAHVAAQQALADAMTAGLQRTYSEIDGILAATLDVDDHLDLETLRVTSVEHPPFNGWPESQPLPPPAQPNYPPNPIWQEPPAPTGMAARLGGMRRHQEAVAKARAAYDDAVAAARTMAERMHADLQTRIEAYQQAEQTRAARLAERRAAYDRQCADREAEAAERNSQLDKLINDLAFDVPWAIQEYVSIILSNSVYPEGFPVEHDFRFDLDTRELSLTARVPPPSEVPTVKEYRYVKAKDEITPSTLPMREQKTRYAGAIWQVAIRTMHEVFEADRAGRILTISLTVDTTTIDPATGLPTVIPMVIVAADRETFQQYDLSKVVPDATLAHLGAAVSKSPFDLVPADTSRGVRARAR